MTEQIIKPAAKPRRILATPPPRDCSDCGQCQRCTTPTETYPPPTPVNR